MQTPPLRQQSFVRNGIARGRASRGKTPSAGLKATLIAKVQPKAMGRKSSLRFAWVSGLSRDEKADLELRPIRDGHHGEAVDQTREVNFTPALVVATDG